MGILGRGPAGWGGMSGKGGGGGGGGVRELENEVD